MKPQNNLIKVLLLSLIIILSSCSKDEETFTPSASNITESIDENPSSGTTIGTIATNLTGTLNYNIVSESVPNAFSVSSSGIVTVNDRFVYDFETNPTLSATISVTNSSDSATSMVNVTLNNVDDIYSFLTTSKASYNNASTDEWIEITREEYNLLASSLNEVFKVSTTDADYDLGFTSTIIPNVTIANNNGATIPTNSYVFAFKYFCSNNVDNTNKVKQSTTDINNGYTDLGNSLPPHEAGERFFVLKGNESPITNEGFLAFYQTSQMGYQSISGNSVHWDNGDVSVLTKTSSLTPIYQGLSTTQKQWD